MFLKIPLFSSSTFGIFMRINIRFQNVLDEKSYFLNKEYIVWLKNS